MTNTNEQYYEQVGQALAGGGVKLSSMFGMKCLKFQRRPLACFDGTMMIFRLSESDVTYALNLEGAHRWVAMGKQMVNWIAVPWEAREEWHDLANRALSFTQTL
jgi:hypothetical protein